MYKFLNILFTLVLIACLDVVVTKKIKGKGKTVARKTTKKTITKRTTTKRTTTKKVTDYCTFECPTVDAIKQVCGSDDIEYLSLCHLKKESCLEKKNVTFQYRGKCDCPGSCSKDYKPICASNEKTYHNLCQMKKDACKLKKIGKNESITVVKKGPCKPWKGITCPDGCTDLWAPVCAVDGKTYSSICSMKMASCKSTHRIGLKKIGYCKNHQCPEHCPDNLRPFCANDGKVYLNECEMRLTACRMRKMTELKRASKKKLCQGKCVSKCPAYDHKVCGSNSVTYKNFCELHRQNCKSKTNVYILKKGPCDPVKDVEVLPKITVNMIPIHAPTLL